MSVSASVAVIGDGATGLSAALLLAKNDAEEKERRSTTSTYLTK